MGKDTKWVFDTFDADKSGHCKFLDVLTLFSGAQRSFVWNAEHPAHSVYKGGHVSVTELFRLG